ncbi:DNA primase [candidate division WOR-3 bacterium]|nr:DNA primase [candidate division WOR-3 bacterium]
MPHNEVVNKIKESVDIVEVIGERIPLKKSGKYYKALCPFHREKTPSFFVSPDLQIYHCFGCGASGDVIKFLQEYDKISFGEALKLLADRAGIKLGGQYEEHNDLYKVNEEAAEIYHNYLFANVSAINYLKKRKINDEIIKQFKLGYAPNGSYIKGKLIGKYGEQTLLSAGLLTKSDSGLIDKFRNRIIFPLFSLSGKIMGFGGRILGTGRPKYLNSPETPIYSKGKTFYSLYHSRNSILKSKSLILVEGYFDYLTMFQAGYKNILAPLGTSLTENQAQILGRYANKVFLFFDNDEAGSKATNRNLGILIDKGVEIRLCITDKGKDPDEIINSQGPEAIKHIIENSFELLDYILELYRKNYDLTNASHLTKVVHSMNEMLTRIHDPVTFNVYKRRIARDLMIEEDLLKPNKKSDIESKIEKTNLSNEKKSELPLLAYILDSPEELTVMPEIEFEEFSLPPLREAIRNLKSGNPLDKDSIVNQLSTEEKSILLKFMDYGVSDPTVVIRKHRLHKIDKKIKNITLKIREQEKKGESVSELLKEQQYLLQEKFRLQKEG